MSGLTDDLVTDFGRVRMALDAADLDAARALARIENRLARLHETARALIDLIEDEDAIVMWGDEIHAQYEALAALLAETSPEPETHFVPEGDRRCGTVHRDSRATCLKRRGHDGPHATPQGHWIDGPWWEYPEAAETSPEGRKEPCFAAHAQFLAEALAPYVENAAPHEQLFSGEDLRNFERASAALNRWKTATLTRVDESEDASAEPWTEAEFQRDVLQATLDRLDRALGQACANLAWLDGELGEPALENRARLWRAALCNGFGTVEGYEKSQAETSPEENRL